MLDDFEIKYCIKLFFSSRDGKHNLKFWRFHINPVGYCLRKDFLSAIRFAMFENSVEIKLLRIPIFTYELIRQNRQSNWT